MVRHYFIEKYVVIITLLVQKYKLVNIILLHFCKTLLQKCKLVMQ
jgi:hypothetical protein